RQFDSEFRRIERVAIGQNYIHSLAFLSLINACRWRETYGHEPDAGDAAGVQIFCQFAALYPGRADQLKRSIGSPAHRNIRSLNQAHARVECIFSDTAEIRRWIHPREAGGIKPV